MPTRFLIAILLCASTACARPAPPALDVSGPGSTRTGVLGIVYGPEVHYFLTDERGTTELRVPDEVWARVGGPRALDRARVRVQFAAADNGEPRVVSIQRAPDKALR